MCLYNAQRRLLDVYLHRLNKTDKRKQLEMIYLKKHVAKKRNLILCRRGPQPQRPIHKHREVVVARASIVDDFTVFSYSSSCDQLTSHSFVYSIKHLCIRSLL